MLDLMVIIVFKTYDRNQATWRLRWLKLGLSMCSKTSSQLGKLILQSFPRESMEPDSIQICLTPCPLGSPKMISPSMYPNLRKRASQDPWTTTEILTRMWLIYCLTLHNLFRGKVFGKHDKNHTLERELIY